jgi:hypothetical protein
MANRRAVERLINQNRSPKWGIDLSRDTLFSQ